MKIFFIYSIVFLLFRINILSLLKFYHLWLQDFRLMLIDLISGVRWGIPPSLRNFQNQLNHYEKTKIQGDISIKNNNTNTNLCYMLCYVQEFRSFNMKKILKFIWAKKLLSTYPCVNNICLSLLQTVWTFCKCFYPAPR